MSSFQPGSIVPSLVNPPGTESVPPVIWIVEPADVVNVPESVVSAEFSHRPLLVKEPLSVAPVVIRIPPFSIAPSTVTFPA